MRRSAYILTLVFLLCMNILPAHAEFSRDRWYEMGLTALDDGTPEAVEMAIDYFDAAGNYDQAKNYKQYCLYLTDIFAMDSEEGIDINNTIAGLIRLGSKEGFETSLQEHGFYSCQLLIDYIGARQLEKDGQLAKAWHAYYVIDDVLDAGDRLNTLTAQVYQIGKAALDDGRYLDAIEALRQLYYADSQELLARAMALVEPTPTPIPTPTSTPNLEGMTIFLSADTASGCNTLTWNLLDGAEQYEIKRHKTGQEYAAVAYITDANTYTDGDVKSGFRYYYTVVAHFSGDRTITSNEVIVIAGRKNSQPTPNPGTTPRATNGTVAETTPETTPLTKVVTIYCYYDDTILDIKYQTCHLGTNTINAPHIQNYIPNKSLTSQEVILYQNGTLSAESISFSYSKFYVPESGVIPMPSPSAIVVVLPSTNTNSPDENP